MSSPRLRAVILFLLALSFGVLILGGYLIRRDKPPIPGTVCTPGGSPVFTGKDIRDGQEHFLGRGGQHIGTIWGHGSYLAPDWSADYLHRTGLFLAARHRGLDAAAAARFAQKDFDALPEEDRTLLGGRVRREVKENRYDAARGTLVFTDFQAEAFRHLVDYYTGLFRNGHEGMGLQPGIVKTDEQGRQVAAFFSWLAWAAGTNRPGTDRTYTSNWPYDPLVGNEALPEAHIWSIVSVVLLILAVAVVLYLYLRYTREDEYGATPAPPEFKEPTPTPSQKATPIFFITAMALFLVQVVTGSLTGHFVVEGTKLFGIPIGDILPYAAARTWHLQLSVFWIATCFLAAGLFIGPAVGIEPKGQKPLVLALFAALVLVVVGTLAGTWASTTGRLEKNTFELGHQGYEYIELGRVFQLALIAGMVLWLVLVVRALRPALKQESDRGGLTHLLLYSSIAIPAFYMAGLLYGRGSHLSDAEYWRWWVVHLWVEGFFEVFATVTLAFVLSSIGAVSRKSALAATYLGIGLYLGGGVIGTFHHLYWSGTPLPILALGGVFSALEVVPLTLIGFEAARNMKLLDRAGAAWPWRWPVLFFVSVAFWNMLGAGVFGFLINPPIVLYYVQGINTTPIHAHTALFGVYGLLAIALMLFSMRGTVKPSAWSDRLLKGAFWGLNGGLLAMTFLSLVPSGFYQFYFAVKHGLWYARSPEITSGPVMRTLSFLRVGPDLVFMAGAALMLIFAVRAAWMSFVKRTDPSN
jgi:nitric oxide reductase subunit B